MSRWWAGWLTLSGLWAVGLLCLDGSSLAPKHWGRLRWALLRSKPPPCELCDNLASDPPRVHWMVKTSPQSCTRQGRCAEVQDTWAARALCYNQTVSFMDSGPGRPEGLSADPLYEYVNYTGPHDRFFLGRKEMWQWRHIARTDPHVDWVAAADDDTYFLVDNVLRYLKTLDPARPVALGRRFLRTYRKVLFNSGGAGYILSRAGINNTSPYFERCAEKWGREPGDNTAAQCWQLAGVDIPDTRDSHGRERFHPFHYEYHHALNVVPKNFWYYSYSTGVAPLHEGADCCGDNETLSFHYMSGRMRSFVWPPPPPAPAKPRARRR